MYGATCGLSRAAENAFGFYILGSRGAMAGFVPPPGIYSQNDFYFYNGSTQANREIVTGGHIIANVSDSIRADFQSLSLITPWQILGGDFGIGAIIPWGGVAIRAGAQYSGPLVNTPTRADFGDSTLVMGDPVLTTVLGWHSGNFHWNISGLMNSPLGYYRAGQVANLAFHRWAGDISGALTYFDPKTGLDLSIVTGMTFNGENPVTHYRTGTEYHLEWAMTQTLAKGLSAGVIGYYYKQITGDGGTGALLGPFKGEIAAFGGTIAYTIDLPETQISTRIKVLREFDATNRLTGTAGFMTVAFPLYAFK